MTTGEEIIDERIAVGIAVGIATTDEKTKHRKEATGEKIVDAMMTTAEKETMGGKTVDMKMTSDSTTEHKDEVTTRGAAIDMVDEQELPHQLKKIIGGRVVTLTTTTGGNAEITTKTETMQEKTMDALISTDEKSNSHHQGRVMDEMTALHHQWMTTMADDEGMITMIVRPYMAVKIAMTVVLMIDHGQAKQKTSIGHQ